MGMTIKLMETAEEKKGKAYVHWKSWHEAYKDIVKTDYLDKLSLEKCEDIAVKFADNTFVAVDEEKRVVGFSNFCNHGQEAPDEGEVTAIYVLSEYYGTGVGKELMDAALEQLKEYPKQEIRVFRDNARAIKFYEKYGFNKSGEEDYLEGLGAAVIKMVRNI